MEGTRMRRATNGAVTIALVFTTGLLTGCVDSGSDGAGAATASRGQSAQARPATTSKPTPPAAVPSPTGKPARGQHNGADVAFAASVVIHHAQGIEMAHILLRKKYIDPVVLSIASRIQSEQGPQIERLRDWLAGWDRPVPASNSSPAAANGDVAGRDPLPPPGLMSADDMAALRRLDGVEGARLFLAMLANHDLGAIQLANDELAAGRNGEARKLALTIIESDQARVRAANELLDGRIHPPGKY
jgi:uncharacterized protein (DUF305 family)